MTDVPRESGGRLGVLQASALYIAAVLGTGILVLPALAARAAGPGSVLAVLAVLVLSVPLAGTFAALASRFPDSGGVATYVRMALGDTAARVSGYLFFFGVVIGAPVVGILAGRYLTAIFGGGFPMVIVIALVVLALPFLSNFWGFSVSGRVQLVLTGALVAIIVLVVALALPSARAENFEPLLPHGWAGVGVAISLMVWAFSGWEAVTHIAAEFRNPRRTIPLATAIAVVAVGIGYVGLQVITVAALGTHAGDSEVPLLTLVALGGSSIGPIVVATIALVVTLGVLNTYTGALAKLGASLGRDGDLPRWFARGAEAGGVPRRALALNALVVATYFVLVMLFGFALTPFIVINTACMLCVYFLGMVAALRLLARWSIGWWFAVISVVLISALLVLAGLALIVPAALVIVAFVVKLAKRGSHAPVPRAL
jgi:amino acid efflux transporter